MLMSNGRLRQIAGLFLAAAAGVWLVGCPAGTDHQGPDHETIVRAKHLNDLAELNDGPCPPGLQYQQEDLVQPVQIAPHDGTIQTELVVRIRERCVPVWVQPFPETPGGNRPPGKWEMQSLNLRTYGFPKDPNVPITQADADDPNSPKIAWSAPGPTFVMHPATQPGASDGTHYKMRLYNRMPHESDPGACVPNLKCNTSGPNAGIDPATGKCKEPIDRNFGGWPPTTPSQVVNGKVIEPPNCFHGANSTNFHFHGFHVSPQLGQDNVGLELRPPLPTGVVEADMPAHGPHGDHGSVAYGHFDFDVDPLRYTQPPGTHWYHAHKHGSTALQVLNGLVGTFEVRGEFDAELESWFEAEGGGELEERLLVVQQLQEANPGLGGADQNGSVLVNGQANPIVRMAKGEIQRWRFVGATMQASAALNVGFPEIPGKAAPEVRQIAMDGVQFSPQNYGCQPFLNNPDCSPQTDETSFEELTSFALSPGYRMDFLVQAPTEPGTYCMVHEIRTQLHEEAAAILYSAMQGRANLMAEACGFDASSGTPPLFTVVVEDRDKAMTFPTQAQFPALASYLADIPPVTDPSLLKDVYYQMVGQGQLSGSAGSQFWITQQKYDPECANESLVLDRAEEWTLWNNSIAIGHPFHIHQNPFQLLSESGRTPSEYTYPVWRDTLAISTAPAAPSGLFLAPNSDPNDSTYPWGQSKIRYVAKEFTGMFVNHCHILGHEDRGMMHNTQSVCANGRWAATGEVPPDGQCDAEGFCTSDCVDGAPEQPLPACETPPDQQSDWPKDYGVTTASSS
ncbi:MAG: multicopper oxidase domain-containing protein [Acidobacteriota bacterium]